MRVCPACAARRAALKAAVIAAAKKAKGAILRPAPNNKER